jgi:hypothetical protein
MPSKRTNLMYLRQHRFAEDCIHRVKANKKEKQGSHSRNITILKI